MFAKRRSTALGIVAAAGLIAAETVAVVLLMELARNECFESLYLLGVVVISIMWGRVLAMATSVASALALAYFHVWPSPHFSLDLENAVVVGVFLVVALLTNLVAIAARARAVETGILAAQQAALRRVATLVARGVSPAEVFSAVADELVRCLGVHGAAVLRFDGDDAAIVVASHTDAGGPGLHVGERMTLEGENVAALALRTKHAVRIDGHHNVGGSFAARMDELAIYSRVAVPVLVDDKVWGVAVAISSPAKPMPADTESRIADFADLVATAIANAATRADLIASRARIVAAADDARRRIERDLHDGAQQRLVSLGVKLRMAQDSVPAGLDVLTRKSDGEWAGRRQPGGAG
jgi:K+-sensing histidine kinase KdpD